MVLKLKVSFPLLPTTVMAVISLPTSERVNVAVLPLIEMIPPGTLILLKVASVVNFTDVLLVAAVVMVSLESILNVSVSVFPS